MKRILFMLLIAFFPAVETGRAQSQAPKQDTHIDLNGKWKTGDGDEVIVRQSGQSLTATFVSGGNCQHGGARSYYIQGSLKGNSLTGDLQRCTRNKKLLDDCSLMDPHSVKFTATVTTTTISGTYRADYINYDEENGRFINCRTKIGGGSSFDFTLTRKCEGVLYAGTLDGRIYSEPSTASTPLGSPVSGSRLCYTRTTDVNGQIWYYVESPGRPAGWMSGRQLSDTRPVQPRGPKIIKPIDSGLATDSPTAAQTAGGRG